MANNLDDAENRYGYIFYRESGWYPVFYDTDAEAIKGAEMNPGTIKVSLALTERVIWEAPKH